MSMVRRLLQIATVATLCAGLLHAQQIAFTMDDLPAHSALPPGVTRLQVAEQVLNAFHDAGLPPVYGFVNAVWDEREPGDEAVLDRWRAAGNPLGSHTWSHMNLNGHTAGEFEADIAKDEATLQAKMPGEDWRWLRYPFLAEGETPEKRAEVRHWLAQPHYRIAAVTMSFADYAWNEPYARCMSQGNAPAVGQLEASYLEAARAEAQWELAASQQALGRELPFVLLMHIGAFDAHMLPRLLAQYKAMGFSFVTLQAAERDPFYASYVDPALPAGPPNLAAAAKGKGVTLPPPPPAPSLDKLCR